MKNLSAKFELLVDATNKSLEKHSLTLAEFYVLCTAGLTGHGCGPIPMDEFAWTVCAISAGDPRGDVRLQEVESAMKSCSDTGLILCGNNVFISPLGTELLTALKDEISPVE